MNKFIQKRNKIVCWNSPIGCLEISWRDKTLVSLRKKESCSNSVDLSVHGFGQLVVQQLSEYFIGQRRKFDIPLAPQGTQFQKLVWDKLCDIPYGQTRCYQEIAKLVGNSNSARAVGMANKLNPIAIIIPCHRVVGKNGNLVGYSGGLDMKSRLLKLEDTLNI